MTVGVFDSQGYNVADGTLVDLSAILGAVTPSQGGTSKGQLDFAFTAGTQVGDALITATTQGESGPISAQTTIHILDALPDQLLFTATPQDLSSSPTTTLLATVRDQWGVPLANQLVRIGAENDGGSGLVSAGAVNTQAEVGAAAVQAGEVVTLTTNAQGQVSAIFTKADGATGSVGVRAELLFDQGSGLEATLVARHELLLSQINTHIFLPQVNR
jgi:hypothetical protein